MSLLRLTGPSLNPRPIFFIVVLRTHTGIGLHAAKTLSDQFQTTGTLDLPFPDPATARTAAEELLRLNLVTRAELVTDDNPAGSVVTPSPPPPAPPTCFCPHCQTQLKNRLECPTCGWLGHPGNRTLWNTQGPCPRCGFAYRFDGVTCSHCGVGAPPPPPPPHA